MAKGDIVLVTFPFTDLSGSKLRPAVMLIDGGEDFTACFITTRLHWQEETDLYLEPTSLNGLKRPSLVRISKLATLDKAMARGLLGQLTGAEIKELDKKLKVLLKLH
ncbi:MAG: type II toxin-antitoxin system PemK/MazF family toxin [Flavobacteriales bacterium]|nr:type II toxin-antitoxin system PemK/MazF family toxin [Flavobacteriales bacterium]